VMTWTFIPVTGKVFLLPYGKFFKGALSNSKVDCLQI